MAKIPQSVKEYTLAEGYNHVEYVCDYHNTKAYSVGIKGKDGLFEPIGMPEFILADDNRMRFANDKEREELMCRIYLNNI